MYALAIDYAAIEIVKLETLHAAPEPIVVELRFRFAADVPIEKSTLRTNPLVSREPHDAVPDATAFALVKALHVIEPAEAAPASVAEPGSVTSNT